VIASFCSQFQFQAGSAKLDNLKTALAEQHPTMLVCNVGLQNLIQSSGLQNSGRSVNPARNCPTPLRERNLETRHLGKRNASLRLHAIATQAAERPKDAWILMRTYKCSWSCAMACDAWEAGEMAGHSTHRLQRARNGVLCALAVAIAPKLSTSKRCYHQLEQLSYYESPNLFRGW
jgi:hypothetical protein